MGSHLPRLWQAADQRRFARQGICPGSVWFSRGGMERAQGPGAGGRGPLGSSGLHGAPKSGSAMHEWPLFWGAGLLAHLQVEARMTGIARIDRDGPHGPTERGVHPGRFP